MVNVGSTLKTMVNAGDFAGVHFDNHGQGGALPTLAGFAHCVQIQCCYSVCCYSVLCCAVIQCAVCACS